MTMRSALAILTLLAGLVACGAGDGVCKASHDDCICDDIGACDWTCSGGDCAFEALGTGDATFACEDGGCTLDADGQGDVSMTCEGGGCSVTANGPGDVSLSCAGGGCSVDCDGQGTCTITECTDCACTSSVTGTCVGA